MGYVRGSNLFKPIIILETFRGKKNKEKLEAFCKRFNYFHQYISADNYLLRQITVG